MTVPHSLWLYSAAPLGNLATSTLTQHLTHSLNPTHSRKPAISYSCQGARLGNDKCQFWRSWVWLDPGTNLQPVMQEPSQCSYTSGQTVEDSRWWTDWAVTVKGDDKVEHAWLVRLGQPMRATVSLKPGRVKPVTYKFDSCHYLIYLGARHY